MEEQSKSSLLSLLDGLNPKQRLKEFKSTQKDFRSKDNEVKLAALQKLVDLRYLSEGSCLLPFLLSIQPKKKTIAFLSQALALFAQHLSPHFDHDNDHHNKVVNDNKEVVKEVVTQAPSLRAILRASLVVVFESDRELVFLQGLLDALVYKDEVKPPKQQPQNKKLPKGAPPPPPPPPPEERPEVVQMRRSALQVLFYLTESLREEEEGVVEEEEEELVALRRRWAALETTTHRLQLLLPSLLPLPPSSSTTSTTSEVEKETERLPLDKVMVQDAIYLLRLLEFQMNYCPSNRAVFATSSTSTSTSTSTSLPQIVLHSLLLLHHHPVLRTFLLQIVFYLTTCSEGLACITASPLVDELSRCCSSLLLLLQPPPPPTTTATKKDEKGKKGGKDAAKEANKEQSPHQEEGEEELHLLQGVRGSRVQRLCVSVDLLLRCLLPLLLPSPQREGIKKHLPRVLAVSLGGVLNGLLLKEEVWRCQALPRVHRLLHHALAVYAALAEARVAAEAEAAAVDDHNGLEEVKGEKQQEEEEKQEEEEEEGLRGDLCRGGAMIALLTLSMRAKEVVRLGRLPPPPPSSSTSSTHQTAEPVLDHLDHKEEEEEVMVQVRYLRKCIDKALFALLATRQQESTKVEEEEEEEEGSSQRGRWRRCASRYRIKSRDHLHGLGSTFLHLLGDLIDGRDRPSPTAEERVAQEKEASKGKKTTSATTSATTSVVPAIPSDGAIEGVAFTACEVDQGCRAVRLLHALVTSYEGGGGKEEEEELLFAWSGLYDVVVKVVLFLQRLLRYCLGSGGGGGGGGGEVLEGLAHGVSLLLFALRSGSTSTSSSGSSRRSSSAEFIKILATRDRLALFVKAVERYGPTSREVEEEEVVVVEEEERVVLIDPRDFFFVLPTSLKHSVELVSQQEEEEEVHLLRPLLLHLFALLCAADGRYRSFEGSPTLPWALAQPVSRTLCDCEEASLLAIQTVSSKLFDLMLYPVRLTRGAGGGAAAGGGGGENDLAVEVDEGLFLNEEVEEEALEVLDSIAKSQVLGVLAAVEALGGTLSSSSSSNTDNPPPPPPLWSSSSSAMRKVLAILPLTSSSTSEGGGGEGSHVAVTWQRPLVFGEEVVSLLSTSTSSTSSTALAKATTLWPFFAVAAAFLSVLTRRVATSKRHLSLALLALQRWSRCEHFGPANQPVFYDLFCTSFLYLGGGVVLAGLLGKFGNLVGQDKLSRALRQSSLSLLRYLVSRGSVREVAWRQHYLDTHLAPPPAATTTAGKGTAAAANKKEDKSKKAAAAASAATTSTSVVAEVVYNVESVSEEVADPNHGPSRTHWQALIDRRASSAHLLHPSLPLLSAIVLGGLSGEEEEEEVVVVEEVVAQGVDVNLKDCYGRPALVYALLLDDQVALRTLFAQPSLCVNGLDYLCVPYLHYNYYGIPRSRQQEVLPGRAKEEEEEGGARLIWTLPTATTSLLAFGRGGGGGGVDVNVSDRDGLLALHLCLGLGRLEVTIAGHKLLLRPAAYNLPPKEEEEEGGPSLQAIHEEVRLLVDAGVRVTSSCAHSRTALHVAVARGDVNLLRQLLLLLLPRQEVNALDCEGRHALHYLLATCPPHCEEIFSLLYDQAVYLPLKQEEEEVQREEVQRRCGRAEEEEEAKALDDLNRYLDDLLADCRLPAILTQQRLQPLDLLLLRCLDGEASLLSLCLAGRQIPSSSSSSSAGGGSKDSFFEDVFQTHSVRGLQEEEEEVKRRLAMARYLLQRTIAIARGGEVELCGYRAAKSGRTTLHACLLLLLAQARLGWEGVQQQQEEEEKVVVEEEGVVKKLLDVTEQGRPSLYEERCQDKVRVGRRRAGGGGGGGLYLQDWVAWEMATVLSSSCSSSSLVDALLARTLSRVTLSLLRERPLHFLAALPSHYLVVPRRTAEAVVNAVVALLPQLDNSQKSAIVNEELSGHPSLYLEQEQEEEEGVCVLAAGAPLHLAILSGQSEVLAVLLAHASPLALNLNSLHGQWGLPPATLLCYLTRLDLLLLLQGVGDRLDFAVAAPALSPQQLAALPTSSSSCAVSGSRRRRWGRSSFGLRRVTCVDVALMGRSQAMLEILAVMRRNDVIEQLLAEKPFLVRKQEEEEQQQEEEERRVSWLRLLEEEHRELVHRLQGMVQAMRKTKEVVEEVVAEIVREEEQEEEGEVAVEGEEEEEEEGRPLSPEQAFHNDAVVTFTIADASSPQKEQEEEEEANPDPLPPSDNAIEELPLTPLPQTLPQSLPSNDSVTTEVVVAAVRPEEVEEVRASLSECASLVRWVVTLVHSSGIVTEDYHLHSDYFQGEIYDGSEDSLAV